MTTHQHTSTLTEGTLTEGTFVRGTSSGPGYTSTWSGIYDGSRLDEGDLYHLFRDGEINGIEQGHHGMPVLRFVPPVGARVEFREETPQHAKNQGIVYVVQQSPTGEAYSVDEHGLPYVWLVVEGDVDKAPSRQRRRSGWATALRVLA